MDSEKFRKELVRFLERVGAIKSERIKKAFLRVPREIFAPYRNLLPTDVYTDGVVITHFKNGKVISTSSQPSLMAKMIELAGIKEGYDVLEIGTGTGYNAAIISEVVGNDGKVVTVEVEKELCEIAQANFERLGLKNIVVLNSDGDPEDLKNFAPFDAVIVTVGIDFPKRDFVFLIASDRKICFPLNFHTIDQNPTCVMQRIHDNFLFSVKIATRFLRALGKLAWREKVIKEIDNLNFKDLEPIDEFKLKELYYERFVEFLELLTLSLYKKSGKLIYIDETGFATIVGERVKIYKNIALRESILRIASLWRKFGSSSIFDLSFKVTYEHGFPNIEPIV